MFLKKKYKEIIDNFTIYSIVVVMQTSNQR